MLAAWRAARRGRSVLLLEATPRLGSKIRISGGGKCNVTHAGTVKQLLAAFPKSQARFLRPAFHAFSNADLVDLLHKEGLETWVREDGRVFPLDRPGSARAVVEALESVVRREGVSIHLEARVEGLEWTSGRLTGFRAGGSSHPLIHCILATGGASYPRTGTLGESNGWLQALGLPVRPWFPALAPLPLEKPRQAWEGVAFRFGELLLKQGREGRILARFPGDLVFTREGVSGPSALELSEAVEEARRSGPAWLAYAFVATGDGRVEEELLRRARSSPSSTLANWLGKWIPERICEGFLGESGIPIGRKLKELAREERKTAIEALGAFPLGAARAVPLERGEVAAGGLKLEAVDPHTLRVHGWENLQVCGEALDLNGPIGGYNLQAAFSTGFLAGERA
jgi:predicted Rossmann fold flavoprotein